MTFVRSIRGPLCAGALLLGIAGAAHAQKAALVQDIDDPARIPYQEILNCSSPSSNVCQFKFSPVPDGRRREIRLVSCYAQSAKFTNPLVFQSALIYQRITPFISMVLPTQSQSGPSYNGQVYAQTTMFFEQGDTPSVQLLAVDILGGASCTVIGRDIVR